MAAPQSMSKSAVETIRSDSDFIVDYLPDSGDSFRFNDINEHGTEWVKRRFKRLSKAGVIKTVGRHHPSDSGPLKTYRLPAAHREFAEEIVNQRNAPLPCGHSGLRNCGDFFECSYRGCDKEFGREEVNFDD